MNKAALEMLTSKHIKNTEDQQTANFNHYYDFLFPMFKRVNIDDSEIQQMQENNSLNSEEASSSENREKYDYSVKVYSLKEICKQQLS